jgi:membrane protease YdiL (CAAX protease family)
MQNVKHPLPRQILKASWMMYVVMGVVGLSIIRFSEPHITAPLSLSEIGRENLFGLGFLTWLNGAESPEVVYSRIGFVVLLAASAISMMILPLDRVFASIGSVKNLVARTLGGISIWTALGLSLLSAVSEEILFRGALQPLIGIPLSLAACVFVHSGPHGLFSAWSLQSLILAGAFAAIFEQTGSLTLVILIHFLVNFASYIQLRVALKRAGDKAFLSPALLGNPQ